MKPTIGTILQFTPQRGTAHIHTDDGTTWTETLIGWGIVVTWTGKTTGEYETHLEPVLLDEGIYPNCWSNYRDNRSGNVKISRLDLSD